MSAITAYNNDVYHRRYRTIQVELQQNQQRFSERGVATIGTLTLTLTTLAHKLADVISPFSRTGTHGTFAPDRTQEEHHATQSLTWNGYPVWAITHVTIVELSPDNDNILLPHLRHLLPFPTSISSLSQSEGYWLQLTFRLISGPTRHSVTS